MKHRDYFIEIAAFFVSTGVGAERTFLKEVTMYEMAQRV